MSGRISPIASALPGRIRLRHPGFRRSGHHQALASRLAALDGLRVAEGNPAVGSLLLLYDPAVVPPATAEAWVLGAALEVLGIAEPAPAAPSAPASSAKAAAPLKWPVNRVAKIGMMGSMALSLAALGTSKRLHAGAGALFVALALVHTTVHRKRLVQ